MKSSELLELIRIAEDNPDWCVEDGFGHNVEHDLKDWAKLFTKLMGLGASIKINSHYDTDLLMPPKFDQRREDILLTIMETSMPSMIRRKKNNILNIEWHY